ncbi:MAG: c-type cytochrome [Anaerolineales bacterium]
MQKILKGLGYAAVGLLALALLTAAAVYLLSENRLNARFDVPAERLTFQTSPEAVASGEHLVLIRGCTDCHGSDLGGGVVIDDSMLGSIYAANLTTGSGGIGSSVSDEDLARAIRHGVRRDGTGLLVMPSAEYAHLSDGDINAMIAYIRSVPAVDQHLPPVRLTLLARFLFLAGQLPPLAAEIIDHQASRLESPPPAVDASYGEYLALSCTGCHGRDYSGGPVPGAAPGAPESANLTPAGELAGWSEADFMQTLRTGVTPEGRQLDPSVMPWPMTAQMTDLELQAIWTFLQTLSPVQ